MITDRHMIVLKELFNGPDRISIDSDLKQLKVIYVIKWDGDSTVVKASVMLPDYSIWEGLGYNGKAAYTRMVLCNDPWDESVMLNGQKNLIAGTYPLYIYDFNEPGWSPEISYRIVKDEGCLAVKAEVTLRDSRHWVVKGFNGKEAYNNLVQSLVKNTEFPCLSKVDGGG